MEVELVKTFKFSAAPCLTSAPEGHKCRSLHGHSYRVDFHVVGKVDEHRGWLIDFSDLEAVVASHINALDHGNLNEVPGLVNSTSEMVAKYLWDKIKPKLSILSAVTVWESDTARCIYRGE